MSEQNKAVVRQYYEALDAGDFDTLASTLADDFKSDFLGQDFDKANYVGMGQGFLAAVPDLKHVLGEQVAEGDTVITPLVATGSMQGELMGMPASGKSFELVGINTHRLSGGKIVFHTAVFDGGPGVLISQIQA
jgi:steroid delta-isomerase-like uncharacterized protein